MLPTNDNEFLRDLVPGHVVVADAGMTCVVIPGFPLGNGFTQSQSDLLLRLSPGYPDVPPDMWWFSPSVRRLDGIQIVATQLQEHHLNRDWQRWSRHLTPGQWQSGVDGIESYLAIVRRELRSAAVAVAA